MLATKRARVDTIEASLVAKSTHFDESLAKSVKLCLLLAEARSQVEKDLAKAGEALGKVEMRATKVKARIT